MAKHVTVIIKLTVAVICLLLTSTTIVYFWVSEGMEFFMAHIVEDAEADLGLLQHSRWSAL